MRVAESIEKTDRITRPILAHGARVCSFVIRTWCVSTADKRRGRFPRRKRVSRRGSPPRRIKEDRYAVGGEASSVSVKCDYVYTETCREAPPAIIRRTRVDGTTHCPRPAKRRDGGLEYVLCEPT